MSSSDMETGGRSFGKELTERPRAVAQAALSPVRYEDRPLPQAGMDRLQADAQKNGFIAGVAACFVSSGAVFMANALSPRFRRSLGVSGKAALVVTPTAGAFFLNSLLTVDNAIKDPAEYHQRPSAAAMEQPGAPKQSSLAFWQTACNTIYQHPFKTIIGIASPIYGALFYRESTAEATKNMLLSQRLIHTRVYGQMVAVLSTVGVMSFCKVMEDNGEYRLVDGVVTRSKQKANPYRAFYEEDGGMALSGHRKPGAPPEPSGKVRSTVADDKAMLADMERRRQEREAREEKEFYANQSSEANLLVPLLYAPLLPMLRIGLRNRVSPERLTQITAGVIGVALVHAGTIMFSDSSVAMRK